MTIDGVEVKLLNPVKVQLSNSNNQAEIINDISFEPGEHIVTIDNDADYVRYLKGCSRIGHQIIRWRKGELKENPHPNLGILWNVPSDDPKVNNQSLLNQSSIHE
jgi:hypothetical protein